MRLRPAPALALVLLAPACVPAAPSPAAYFQQPLSAVASRPSRWRSFSAALVESIWGSRVSVESTSARSGSFPPKGAAPLPHTLARYGGDVVLRFNVSTADEAASLAAAADTLLLDIWEFTHYWVDIRLARDVVPSLLGLLPPSLHQSHAPLLLERDLAQAIYDTYPTPRDRSPAHVPSPAPHLRDRPFSPALHPVNTAETNIFFSDYQPLTVIEPWLRLLASLFTTHVRLLNIGISYEGRSIPALRVGVHPTNDENPHPQKRQTLLIAGGLHAREWIGTSTVNYVAYSLITGYGKIPSITRLLEDFDFVFIPTLNPDGYVYTWESDRLWRKNRQQTSVRFCQGIDLDRGFGFAWDGMSKARNPCSESFAGETPFQAVEAKRLAEWARNETEHNNVEFVGFIDLHSYSQEILYPYSYTCKYAAPGQENLEELALGLEKAIRISSGQEYQVMPACEGNFATSSNSGENRRTLLPRIEDAGGSPLDWFYHEMHVRYAYQIKLRDRGTYGFLLPKENIVPTGEEILDAVLYFGSFLSDLYNAGAEERNKVEIKKPSLDLSDVPREDETLDRLDPMDDNHDLFDMETMKEISEEELSVGGGQNGDDGDWIIVEDLDSGEPQWDLRRRRRR